MRSFLPERGRFTFPAPYGTEGIRVTNASDCGGSDCVEPVRGLTGRNIDAHRGRASMLVFLGLRDRGPTLFRVNKGTGQSENLGPLFDAASPFASRSVAEWYFSARRPGVLYLTSGALLLRYDVLARTFETVFDATTEFGQDRVVVATHSSDGDDAHSALLRDAATGATLGCLAYREDTGRFSYHPARRPVDRCLVDAGGRRLVVQERADEGTGAQTRIVDLDTGVDVLVPDEGALQNLDATGRYFIWVGHTGDRSDAFLVKVPERLLARGRPGKTDITEVSALDPDPLGLPLATTAQVPLTVAYNALNVPSRAAGSFYLDPTTSVRIYKLTSATYPAAAANWGHDYAEGGDEISLPYNGETRAVLVRQNGGTYWLIDFTPGVGVGNARPLTGPLAPHVDVAFAFSNNPATPYYAYVGNGGSTIRRFDIRTMTEAPGGGWPVTGETGAIWIHQSANDGMFVWMRGANGTVGVAYDPATGTRKTFSDPSLNEPRIDRGGRYVGLNIQPGNILRVWDWNTGSIAWSTPGDPGIPFGHAASLKRRWVNIDQNMSYPPSYNLFTSDVPNSATHFSGPANATLYHCNGNWIQDPADLNDQWAMCTHYGSLRPPESYWLAPGAFVLLTANGQRRVLGHPYNTTNNYAYLSFPKFSSDGKYVLFTSNMNGAARSDVFLAELPQTGGAPDTTPPTVSVQAPANGATVSGVAVTVSGSASDNVGVAGVQFKLDGVDLGAEDTAAPYGVAWNTLLSANGSHSLSAVARDAAGNSTTSVPIGVTVSNFVDVTPPVLSGVGASGTSSTATNVSWTTDEAADTQVDYGTTAAYGSSTALAPALVTSHSQALAGLAAATLYHYRVRSRDAAGNLAVSTDFTFATLPAPGPLAHWKLDEGAGTTAADDSGNGHLATLVNGAAWSAGRSGQGLSLDGADDYASVPHAAALDAFPLSISVWFKTSTTAGVRGLVNKYVAGSYNGYQIFFDTGALCAWFLRDTSNFVYDNTGCSMRTPGYNDGLWHHVVFVADAAGARLHVDAVQKASQPWTGTPGPSSTIQELHIGHYPGAFGGAEYLSGLVDDVRIYDRALSPAEISQMYDEMPPIEDTVPPVISSAAATGVTGTGATINWTTDEPADSQVDYGTTAAYGSSTALAAPPVTAHDQALSGLVSATLYHFRVRSRDAAGNLAVSDDFTFTTPDTIPPLVAIASPVTGQLLADVVSLSASASDSVGVAGVQFRVDGLAVGAEDTAPPYSISWDTRTVSNASHAVTAVARDAAGNSTTSVSVAVVVSNGDVTPPVLSLVSSSGVSSSGATVGWTTSEPADTQIDYGTTTAYGSSTTLAPALVISHSQPLGGLAVATLYHYRARSRDAAGNLAVSGDFTFTTLAAPGSIVHWKLDDGGGSNAADSSGNNRNGTLMNGPVWTAGRSGLALGLDGVNDYVRTAHAGTLNAFPVTVSAWFKTTTAAGTRGLVNKYLSNSYNGYQIFFENGSLCAWYLRSKNFYVYDRGTCTMRTNGYNDGLWHHVAFVVDATGGKLYVDGAQRATQPWRGTPGAPTTTQEVRVGHYPGGSGAKYLPGGVDDVRIYNRALSASEVLQLYNVP